MIKIKKISTAVPKNNYNQEEVLNILNYHNARIKGIFSNSRIKKRHFIINEKQKLPITDNEEYYNLYSKNALNLCKEAITQLEINIKDINHLVFVSSTGMSCPGLGFHLINELSLNEDTEVQNIIGHGCNGVFWGIQNSINYLSKNPEKKSVVVAVETCSITCYPDDSLENAVANAIFSDGAASILLEDSENNANESIEIVDTINITKPHFIDLLGFRNKFGTLRVNLSKELPNAIEKSAYPMIEKLLERNHLSFKHINSWIVHPGGRAILEIIEKTFNFKENELRSSWQTLNDFGNISSPTILFVLKNKIKSIEKGYGIMMGFGPGLSLNAILVKI